MKKTVILLTTLISLIMLSGCRDAALPYNAVTYGNVYENRTILKDDFYESNLTYGSYSTAIENYIKDEKFPSYRSKIIQTENEYETVFKEFPVKIDFEKTMIIMHCFTTASGSSYEIIDISIYEKNLVIRYKTVKSNKEPPNASVPLSKWIIVTMDKLDIEAVEFIFDN